MANYRMICRSCEQAFELTRPMAEGPPDDCHVCGASEEEGFTQDWSGKHVLGWTYGEDHMTTVGQQMEFNARRTSKEERELAQSAHAEKKESIWNRLPGATPIDTSKSPTPFWRDGSIEGLQKLAKPLDLKQVRDTDKYIHTGATT